MKTLKQTAPENDYLYQCDCCDRMIPFNKMVWANEIDGVLVKVKAGENGQLGYGAACWKKVRK